jgi:hypothetical protein
MFSFLKSEATLESDLRKWLADERRRFSERDKSGYDAEPFVQGVFEMGIDRVVIEAASSVLLLDQKRRTHQQLLGTPMKLSESMHVIRGMDVVNAYTKRAAIQLDLSTIPVTIKMPQKKTALKAVLENPIIQQQKGIFEAANSVCQATGVDADELPDAHGEFGFESTNPIPTNTVFGSNRYLAHLRIPSGERVNNRRIRSGMSSVTTWPVDIYEITSSDGRVLAVLHLSPYQKRNSRKAPKGFLIVPSQD